jgi:hypothetical protein
MFFKVDTHSTVYKYFQRSNGRSTLMSQGRTPDEITTFKSSEEGAALADQKSVLFQPLSETEINQGEESQIQTLKYRESPKRLENPVVSLRNREVVLAKVSLCIVVIFFICHGIRIVPNTFEMVQTYMAVSLIFCL